jgi:hypothetical protein
LMAWNSSPESGDSLANLRGPSSRPSINLMQRQSSSQSCKKSNPMKTNSRFLVFLLALAATPAFAQTTLVQVASENDSVTSGAAITYDFGALSGTTTSSPAIVCSATTHNCLAPSVTTTMAVSNMPVINGIVSKTDPAVGVAKALYVAATSVVQTGSTKSGSTGVVTAWSVPALAAVVPTAAAVPALVLTITGATITTPITLKLGGTLGWCTFVSANDSGNYGISLSGCLTPPPSK